ncbi:PIN domain-containing protein [Micromonospora zamorensis]|uniref:PIN domain-containing protein n=1 Tax=Micromonospora zamorensis TaxID=709883 RepID=UPI002ED03013|nr:PIN domain-containing protein [Micromonospora zamorensis]
MLRLLVDTSVWLDMAKHRDGQKLIVPIRVLFHQKRLRLIVPSLVVEEFERNRPRVEASVSASVAERVRQLKSDLNEYGGNQREQWLEEMSHRLPLLSSLSLRNFTEIRELLSHPAAVEPSSRQQASVILRALEKRAPFHLAKNSVADALLIEMFRDAVKKSQPSDVCCFATSNHQDFSLPNGDRRKPHPDFNDIFGDGRVRYLLGLEGLAAGLTEHFGEKFEELVEEVELVQEEPRTLVEILEAEREFFDKIWYVRKLIRQEKEERGEADPTPETLALQMEAAMRHIEDRYGADNVGPWDDWGWGFVHGKLSALRWVLGSEWDFLDT